MKCPVTMILDEVGVHVALKRIYTDGVLWRVGGYVRKDTEGCLLAGPMPQKLPWVLVGVRNLGRPSCSLREVRTIQRGHFLACRSPFPLPFLGRFSTPLSVCIFHEMCWCGLMLCNLPHGWEVNFGAPRLSCLWTGSVLEGGLRGKRPSSPSLHLSQKSIRNLGCFWGTGPCFCT